MIVSVPAARLEPFTVKVAVALPEVPVSVAVPSCVEPTAKLTPPPGATVPDAGFTVIVSFVEVFEAKLGELALTVMVVATGEVMVTVVEPLDPEKLPVAA